LPPLVFLDSAHTVQCGKRSARLSPKQFALLKCVYERQKVSYEELQDAVWRENASDTLIRKTACNASSKLVRAGINAALSTRNSAVEIEPLG